MLQTLAFDIITMKWFTLNTCLLFLSLITNCPKIEASDLEENFYVEERIEDLSDFVSEFHQSWFRIDKFGKPVEDVQHFQSFMADLNIEMASFFRSFEQSLVSEIYRNRYVTHIRRMKDAFAQVFSDLERIVRSKHHAKNDTERLKHSSSFANTLLKKYVKEDPMKIIHRIIYDNFIHSDLFTTRLMDNDEYVEDVCVPRMTPSQLMHKLFQYYELATAGYHTTHAVVRQLVSPLTSNEIHEISKEEFESNLKKNYNSLVREYIDTSANLSRVLRVCVKKTPVHVTSSSFHEIKLYDEIFVEACQTKFVWFTPFRAQCDTLVEAEMCEDVKDGGNCALLRNCNGKIRCKDLKSDKKVCLTKSLGSRKHDTYINPKKLSDPNGCMNPYSLTEKDFSKYFGFKKTKCTPCHCTCEANDLYYSTDLVTTDVESNMIVTGAKLELSNNDTLVIRIQQGRLMPTGKIDRYSEKWLPVNITNRKRFRQSSPEWIDLTKMNLPQGEILTGLGFSDRMDLSSSNNHIFLQAQSNTFDYWSGLLNRTSSVIVASTTETESHPQLVKRYLSTNSTEVPGQYSSSLIKRNRPVQFTVIETEDGEQSTVPYIDGREVFADPPMLMSGAGLYLREEEHDGGFIGIELITHDSVSLTGVNSRNTKRSA